MRKITVPQKISLIIFGLLFGLCVLEIGLHLAGWAILTAQELQNKRAMHKKGDVRIMCIGESTTAGGEESYPAQLEQILNEQNIGIHFSVINKGVPGISSAGILAQLKDNLDTYHPDMVITMIGANDGESLVPYDNGGTSSWKIFLLHFVFAN